RAVTAQTAEAAAMEVDAHDVSGLDDPLRGPPPPGVRVLLRTYVELGHVFTTDIRPGGGDDGRQIELRQARLDGIAERADRLSVLFADASIHGQLILGLHRSRSLARNLGGYQFQTGLE